MSIIHNQSEHQTLVRYFSSWASGLEYINLPQQVQSISKKTLLDVVAVGIAGLSTRVSQQTKTLALKTFSSNQMYQSTLFNGERTSPQIASYCNAVSAHALVMDDTCFAGIVHASVLIGPTVLAFAEASQKSGKDVLVAFAVGSEITYSLGAAVGSFLYERDWWPTGLLGVIGAAAALAKLNNLDKNTIARAIAFAALNASPLRCMQGTDSKPLVIGETVKRAIDAVEIAQTELSVPLDVFERAEGPMTVTVGEKFDRERAMQLGQKWRLIDPGLTIKLFPLCSCAQSAVEALLKIIEENILEEDTIESVSVVTTSMVARTLCFDQPTNENEAMFSLTYPLACLLVDKNLKPEHISLESINRTDIQLAMNKIAYQADDSLFDLNESPEAAIVIVKTHDGQAFEQKCPYPTGDSRAPVTEAQFKAKIKTCIGIEYDVDKFMEIFENLDYIQNIEVLTNHFKGINRYV